MGEAAAIETAKRWKADIVVTNYDTWPLKNMYRDLRRAMIPTMAWAPFDFLPHYRATALWGNLVNATSVLPYSRYGEENFRKHLEKKQVLRHCYLGVDTSVFQPVIGDKLQRGGTVTKEMLREKRGFPEGGDIFLVFINKMNKAERVAYPYMLEGFKLFAENNPDVRPRLYLHADLNAPGGYPLDRLIVDMGLSDLVRFTSRFEHFLGLSPVEMSALYNSADVLLNSTLSEGFGAPIAEALCCGVPVVATDWGVMHEILEPVCKELLVQPQAEFWHNVPGKYVVPSVEGIADALERCLSRDPEKDMVTLSRYGRKMFDYDTAVYPRFLKAVGETMDLSEEMCWRTPEPSQELVKRAAAMEVAME